MPPGSNPLTGVWAKIERAKQHVTDYDRVYDRLVRQYGDMVHAKEDSQVRERVYYLNWDNPDTTAFAVWAGDIVHNLRSALDHLAYALCVAGPGGEAGAYRARKQIYFPIANGEEDYRTSRHREKVLGLSKPGLDEILDATEPYRGGKGEALYHISELDKADKHRLLVTVAFTNARLDEGSIIERTLLESNPEWAGRLVFSRPDDVAHYGIERLPGERLKAGRVLLREHMHEPPKQKGDFVADITLNEPEIVKPQSLRSLLTHSTLYVDRMINAFSDFV